MAGGRTQGGPGKAVGSPLLRVVGADSFSVLSSCPADAAPGNAGADAELWTAADPGRGPHPGWAALLPALPGGHGPLCAGESGAWT